MKTSIIVPVKDVEMLASKMEELIKAPDKIIQMATVGRRIVEEKFDAKKVNQEIIKTLVLA